MPMFYSSQEQGTPRINLIDLPVLTAGFSVSAADVSLARADSRSADQTRVRETRGWRDHGMLP